MTMYRYVRVLELKDGSTVAFPSKKGQGDARIVSKNEDGSFTAHWVGNWNLSGDFSSELMSFDSEGVLDTGERDERNSRRVANGLMATNY